jgi:hypothetical protein
MAFYHVDGSETLIVTYHEVLRESEWEMPVQVEASPGVEGVGHLVDKRKQRPISLRCWYQGFSTIGEIYTGCANLDALQGVNVTVRWKQGGTTQYDWDNCTFVGFTREGPPQWDPEHGWWIRGTLHWVQRLPN